MKLVQISDTHISHHGGITNDNFERIARFVNEDLRPDLVVISGDINLLSPDDAADRRTAKEMFAQLAAPTRVLAGNHDVGEPGAAPWAGFSATSERVTAFTTVFGPGHWVEICGDYAVLGLNSEILSTGLPEEQAQWDWLATVPEQVAGRAALVFCHKPFWSPMPEVTEHAMAIPDDARERLLAILDDVNVLAYGSGHLHHYATDQHDAAVTVSAPSTAFVVRGHDALVGPGLNQLGVVEYRCSDGTVEPYFRSVPHLVEGSPLDVAAFSLALSELGVTVEI